MNNRASWLCVFRLACLLCTRQSIRFYLSSFGNATNERALSMRAPMKASEAESELLMSIIVAWSNERFVDGTAR